MMNKEQLNERLTDLNADWELVFNGDDDSKAYHLESIDAEITRIQILIANETIMDIPFLQRMQ